MHKPVLILKGNNPILLSVYKEEQFPLSSTEIAICRILMSQIVMQKSDLKIGLISQKSEWLASLKGSEIGMVGIAERALSCLCHTNVCVKCVYYITFIDTTTYQQTSYYSGEEDGIVLRQLFSSLPRHYTIDQHGINLPLMPCLSRNRLYDTAIKLSCFRRNGQGIIISGILAMVVLNHSATKWYNTMT